jgi:N-acyl-D-amino-acid deacylase
MTLDIVIEGGRLVDGTGTPWRRADVGIVEGRVAAIGRLQDAAARCRIAAAGRVVCPGFIDIHAHADLTLPANKGQIERLRQGITTEVLGQDGLSYAPASPEHLPEWRRYLMGMNGDGAGLDWAWSSVAEYLERLEGKAANAVYLVPHGAVRVETMGWADRPATAAEMRRMAALVTAGLEQGALGLSTGLSYVPCAHATTEELIALCRPVAEAGGILAIHLRSYGSAMLDALDEAISVGRATGVAVQVSHLRVSDPVNWGKSPQIAACLDAARAEGVDITFDIYPYQAGCACLFSLIPLWAQAGGPDAILARLADDQDRARMSEEMCSWGADWGAFSLSNAPPTPWGDWEGLSLPEAAQGSGRDVETFIMDLLLETQLNATMVGHGGNQEDNEYLARHPAGMVCSDGVLVGDHPHPRSYGTFPRVLAHHVRERRILTLEEAVGKMTAAPAARLNLTDRGVLRIGAAADVVIFDPDRVADRGTYEDGRRPPEGIEWVLVNGQPAIAQGQPTGALAGQVLRRHSFC